MLRLVVSVVLGLHGLIHLAGAAKGFGLATLPALTTPIGRGLGVLWLVAGLAVLAAAIALGLGAPSAWAFALGAAALSQLAIASAWTDARWGTLANVLLLGGAFVAAFADGPFGLHARYRARLAEAEAQVAHAPQGPPLDAAAIAHLPPPVQRYLQVSGAVGRPRPLGFRATMRGGLRGAADADWMPFDAEQVNLFDPPRRTFFMVARRAGIPAHGLHVYDPDVASMEVRLAALAPIVAQSGPTLTRAETVTVLDDMSIFAPGALVTPAIRWRAIDDTHAEAALTIGAYTVTATLAFDAGGLLVDLWSDDRPALSADGARFEPQRWSTPITGYAPQGPLFLPSRGEARYAPPSGPYTYITFERIQTTALEGGAGR
jgi:hypothetical protein